MNSRPGYRKCIANQGMPLMSDPDMYGDMWIEFEIIYPDRLNSEQKRSIKEALINNSHVQQQQQQQQQLEQKRIS
jgi:DnaJ homolog subfamily B member 4